MNSRKKTEFISKIKRKEPDGDARIIETVMTFTKAIFEEEHMTFRRTASDKFFTRKWNEVVFLFFLENLNAAFS